MPSAGATAPFKDPGSARGLAGTELGSLTRPFRTLTSAGDSRPRKGAPGRPLRDDPAPTTQLKERLAKGAHCLAVLITQEEKAAESHVKSALHVLPCSSEEESWGGCHSNANKSNTRKHTQDRVQMCERSKLKPGVLRFVSEEYFLSYCLEKSTYGGLKT